MPGTFRSGLDLTQKDVATELQVTEQTIRNWEHGKTIPRLTIPQVKRLCRLLQCSVDELPDSLAGEQKKTGALS